MRRRTTRLLAILLPATAAAIGAGVEGSRACRVVVWVAAGLAAASGAALVVAGRAAPVDRRSGGASPVTHLVVLIPARDEASVIGGILGDLAVQEPVAAGVEIVVIDDRSRDRTGEIAAAAIERLGLCRRARVLRRDEGADGKGAALDAIPLRPDPAVGLVVLDADARVRPSFLAACLEALSGTTGLATARRRMLRPLAGTSIARRVAAAQDDEQLADDALQRARLRMGGASELRGNGMVIRADVLAELGGWGADALCEDLDLSARAWLRAGRSVDRFDGLDVWEQPVLSPRALVRQRIRWAEGMVRRDLAVVLPAQLDPTIPVRRRMDALAYAAHALVPWLAAGLLLRAALPGGTRARGLAAALATVYAVSGAAIAGVALGDPEARRRTQTGRVAGALALEALWLIALPVGWIRVAHRPVDPAFTRTPHLPSGSFAPPDRPC